ncbi:mitofusin, partial [Tulasnella sp. 419]
MAQSYLSTSKPHSLFSSPMESTFKETGFTSEDTLVMNGDVEAQYVERKDRLLDAVDGSYGILSDLRKFNKEAWVIKYPTFKESSNESVPPSPASSSRPSVIRRSMSFADEPSTETEVLLSAPARAGLKRSVTLASVAKAELDAIPENDGQGAKEEECTDLIPEDFHILRLDLKLGPHGSSISPTALVSQLEKASIASLLDERIASSMKHVEKLRLRVQDTSSKVLVTGDLNAGKSTFVNALLGRDVMTVDQQPCTTMFCEVHDAAENDEKEEVHLVNEGMDYSRDDESTFTRAEISELEGIVTESDAKRILKLYVKDARDPSRSLLSNGVVDISLIDAPGLNRDSIHTTELFARQEEIDVVVFVVSAENHFTLSAKEFLLNASHEKAYLFIVVNKFDQIRDKNRCKRLILEQIKQLSPRTWDDAEDLVHFVDSNSALARAALAKDGQPAEVKSGVPAESFEKLESALRSFVLVKRQKSKLLPVATYIHHLMSDVDVLSATNVIVAQNELAQATADLNRVKPELNKMQKTRDDLEDGLVAIEESVTDDAGHSTQTWLQAALDKIGQGELGVDVMEIAKNGRTYAVESLPAYPGILHLWEYAAQVRLALLKSLDLAVKLAEDDARDLVARGVERVFDHGDMYIPPGADRSRRVFRPEAMFSSRKSGRRQSGGAVVAGGMYGLGIGLAQRRDLNEVTIQDIFDIHYHFSTHFGDPTSKSDDEDESTTALG